MGETYIGNQCRSPFLFGKYVSKISVMQFFLLIIDKGIPKIEVGFLSKILVFLINCTYKCTNRPKNSSCNEVTVYYLMEFQLCFVFMSI